MFKMHPAILCLAASQEHFALPYWWFQVGFSFPLPHVRWRCQICSEIKIKTTFSAHSAFKDQCTPLWGQIGRGCRKRPGRMRNTLLITIQPLPVAAAQRTAQENRSSSLISCRALLCAIQSWGNHCLGAQLIAHRLITWVCKKINRCINTSAMLCISQCGLPSL